jgi:hypothetical protein
MEVGGHLHIPTTLNPGKETQPQNLYGRSEAEKNLYPFRESNPDHPVFQPVAQSL